MISKKAANVLNWVPAVLGFPLQCQVVESLGHDFKKAAEVLNWVAVVFQFPLQCQVV